MRILLFTAVKDEGPYILEWLAYHKALGFTDFLIAQNDSKDGTTEILRRLQQLGEIAFIDNDNPKGSPQMAASRLAARTELFNSSDWMAFFDCDEYLNLCKHDTLEDFLDDFSEFDSIAVNWLNFGDSGLSQWGCGLTIERFTQCAHPDHAYNAHFKCLHRPSCKDFQGFGPHRPHPTKPIRTFVYTDKSAVEDDVQLGAVPQPSPNRAARHDIACLHHYSVRTREEFLRKEIRGHAFYPDTAYGGDHKFNIKNTNAIRNSSLQESARSTYKFLWEFLSDPALNEAYVRSCRFHFERDFKR